MIEELKRYFKILYWDILGTYEVHIGKTVIKFKRYRKANKDLDLFIKNPEYDSYDKLFYHINWFTSTKTLFLSYYNYKTKIDQKTNWSINARL